MKLSLPKCKISLSLNNGLVILRCPICKQVLYGAKRSPHDKTRRMIEDHVEKCEEEKKNSEKVK